MGRTNPRENEGQESPRPPKKVKSPPRKMAPLIQSQRRRDLPKRRRTLLLARRSLNRTAQKKRLRRISPRPKKPTRPNTEERARLMKRRLHLPNQRRLRLQISQLRKRRKDLRLPRTRCSTDQKDLLLKNQTMTPKQHLMVKNQRKRKSKKLKRT
jgi:hypothetical protein